ncbi:cobalamin B12-binding domain-containing protein, partial [Clostridium botulinum C/D]|nr:cobalamin B12-binding domain-containing protein [Clostridium botulinum C/D]
MKVLLVGINSKYIHSNLAIRYLRAYTKDLNYDCNIREFSINDREERILKEIINEKPN